MTFLALDVGPIAASFVGMNRLMTGVLFVALSFLPSMARAEASLAPPAVASRVHGPDLNRPVIPSITPGSAFDYAARETAAPELAGFAGGSGGIYIGTGALVVALLVVIIVLVAH